MSVSTRNTVSQCCYCVYAGRPAYMSPCVFVQRAQSRPVHVAIGVLLFIEQSHPCINSYVVINLCVYSELYRYVCSA